jgi:hypothetical protein
MDAHFTSSFKQRLFSIRSEAEFNSAALELFRYQSEHVETYSRFLNGLHRDLSSVTHYSGIPCLPVTMFRDHLVTDGMPLPELCFTSSGTTGQIPSRHFVRDEKLYTESLLRSFRLHYGEPSDYVFLALLPSYLERSGSSLVYMMDVLIRESGNEGSGFYLRKEEMIPYLLKHVTGKKIFLLGVTYALLDLASSHPMDLSAAVIVETGGMKGRRKEMIREEIHAVLTTAFNAATIHSEYGMTELLSQAWSQGNGVFTCPPWMKVVIRDTHDPFTTASAGVIHVMDLANVHSCAFLATQDLGKAEHQGGFTMLGRTDNSELRGCNLMLD